jgi:hypothetical protein
MICWQEISLESTGGDDEQMRWEPEWGQNHPAPSTLPGAFEKGAGLCRLYLL